MPKASLPDSPKARPAGQAAPAALPPAGLNPNDDAEGGRHPVPALCPPPILA